MTISAIILAAGESAGRDFPERLMRRGEQSLLRNAAQAALLSACAPVVVVLGAHIERMQRELNGLPVHVAFNGNWREGMSSAIRAGLQALDAIAPGNSGTEAVILSVCDQLLLTAAQFDALQAQYRKTGNPIVASAYAGSLGVPALFDRSLFAELMGLQDGADAKILIVRHRKQSASVDFPGGEIDIDSQADLAFAAAHPPAA